LIRIWTLTLRRIWVRECWGPPWRWPRCFERQQHWLTWERPSYDFQADTAELIEFTLIQKLYPNNNCINSIKLNFDREKKS
jgi:hypothetical protein